MAYRIIRRRLPRARRRRARVGWGGGGGGGGGWGGSCCFFFAAAVPLLAVEEEAERRRIFLRVIAFVFLLLLPSSCVRLCACGWVCWVDEMKLLRRLVDVAVSFLLLSTPHTHAPHTAPHRPSPSLCCPCSPP